VTPVRPIDVVASDLDGTFLGADGQASPLNCRAVRRAADLGVRVVFATGRPARWLQPLDCVRDARPSVLASNGAVVVDLQTHRVVRSYPVPQGTTAAVAADLLAELPDCGFAVEYADGGWGRTPAYPLRGDFVPENVCSAAVVDLLEAGRPVKLLVYSPSLPTDALMRRSAPVVGDRLSLTYSMVQPCGLLELSAAGVDKAFALRSLLDEWGLGPDRLAAFGDMPNDLPMLALAGYPFAMSDAHPSLLEAGFASAGDHDRSGFGRTLLALLGEPV